MLQAIQDGGGDVKKYVELAKKKDSGFRLMGFGHRVYKNYDPRAKIIKVAADKVMKKMKTPIRCSTSRSAGRGGADRPVLHRAQALPERRLLQRHHLPRDGHPDQHVHGHVRHRPPARAGSPTGKR